MSHVFIQQRTVATLLTPARTLPKHAADFFTRILRVSVGHSWTTPNTLRRYIRTCAVESRFAPGGGDEFRFVQFVMSMRSGIFTDPKFIRYNPGYDTEYSARDCRTFRNSILLHVRTYGACFSQ